MTEFRYGDRVKWPFPQEHGGVTPKGTVVDERKFDIVLGDYQECLPLPVAVVWDEPGEPWWSPGDELELL